MKATFNLKSSEFNESLFLQIKKMFEGKSVTIVVSDEMDETSYLTATQANENHLKESIASEPTISYTVSEFDKHAEDLLNKKNAPDQ